eukprot:scpid108234/ scgid17885/ 
MDAGFGGPGPGWGPERHILLRGRAGVGKRRSARSLYRRPQWLLTHTNWVVCANSEQPAEVSQCKPGWQGSARTASTRLSPAVGDDDKVTAAGSIHNVVEPR